VGQKPVIQYVIEEASLAGIEHILVITTQSKRVMEDFFEASGILSDKIYFIRQVIKPDLPYGLAHAVGLSEGFVGNEPFVVCLGDCIINSGHSDFLLKRMIQTHKERKAFATIAFEEVPMEKVSKYGIARLYTESLSTGIEEFQLHDIVEKPRQEEAPSNLAVAARYVFEPEIFSYIKQTQPGINNELQLTDSIRMLLKDGYPVWGVRLRKDEKRYDIGGFSGYFKAFFDFSIKDKEFGEEFTEYVKSRKF
jgi:UTP--glucose-1-phosphate uridylyltransferase